MVQASIIYARRASTPVLLANGASGDRQPFLLMSEDESGVPTRAKGAGDRTIPVFLRTGSEFLIPASGSNRREAGESPTTQ